MGGPALSYDEGYERVPPAAGALVEALRGVGYSVATAIADLVDNSISANARTVWLRFSYAGQASSVTLLDDGNGMTLPELLTAMTVGAKNPTDARSEGDLGRFGLGLKTASFSQGRRLTLVTKKSGETSSRAWDLDHVSRTNEWQLLGGMPTGPADALAMLSSNVSGTLVILDKLDRIIEHPGDPRRSEDAFLATVDRVEEHLAMVFHRFLEGSSPRLRIFINGSGPIARVKPWDPFLSGSPATGSTPFESIATPQGTIGLRGFVLPHKDFLTDADYQSGGGPGGWTAQQGFYVYRNRRMLVSGGWLGLGDERPWTREEPFKLARIMLDITNTADEEWMIDIRKSMARPPPALRPRLKALAANVRVQARKVFAHRGLQVRPTGMPEMRHAWTAVSSGPAAAYRIARDHPAILRLLEAAGSDPGSAEAALRILEETVPVQRIWLDAVEKGEVKTANFGTSPSSEVMAVLNGLYGHLTSRVGLTPELARRQLLATEPFQDFPEAVSTLGSASCQAPQT